MELKETFHLLAKKQSELNNEYEQLIAKIDSWDPLAENTHLKKEVAALKTSLEELNQEILALKKENAALKMTLKEQIFDERLQLIKLSQKKINTYFETQTNSYNNTLTATENSLQRQIEALEKANKEVFFEETAQISAKINSLKEELQQLLSNRRQEVTAENTKFTKNMEEAYDDLARTEISPEIMAQRAKQNQWEVKIGLSWMNILGILFILFALGTTFQYLYHHSSMLQDFLSNKYIQASGIFLLGISLLIAGVFFYQRGREIFAQGLMGGGFAILYFADFFSYFLLKLFNVELAFLLTMLFTISAVFTAVRYSSPVICSLGLLGGFLPFYIYISNFQVTNTLIYSFLVYFLLLNLSVLGISLWQKWHKINYLGFLLNIPVLIFLQIKFDNYLMGILYTLIIFMIFLTNFIVYGMHHQKKLQNIDFIILGGNTCLNSVFIYNFFTKAKWEDFHGLLALFFCGFYFFLSKYIKKLLPKEINLHLLFLSIALLFAILVIPFQLGKVWLSLGWLVESIILILIGIAYQKPLFERSGWILFSICFLIFTSFDLELFFMEQQTSLFDYKYLSLILGMLTLLITYPKLKKDITIKPKNSFTFFKYFTLVNLGIYQIYLINTLADKYLLPLYREPFLFGKMVIIATLFFLTGYLIKHHKTFLVKGLGELYYFSVIVITLWLNVFYQIFNHTTGLFWQCFFFGILIILNILSGFLVKSLLTSYFQKSRKNTEWHPILIAIFILFNITSLIYIQLPQLELTNLIISITYVLLAIIFVSYGFYGKYLYIRRFGLGLTILAIAKLCFYDLANLSSFEKIIAYFSFGIGLVAISYFYQRLKNSLEAKHETK